MKRFNPFTIVLWFFVNELCHDIAAEAATCPDGFLGHAGSCYHFSHDKETWANAVTVCEKVYRAKLVEIEDRSENNFLLNEANIRHQEYWTGGNDLQVEGEWRWLSSGEDITLNSWSPGGPSNSNGNENCLELNSLYWNDDECDKNQLYICEASSDGLGIVG